MVCRTTPYNVLHDDYMDISRPLRTPLEHRLDWGEVRAPLHGGADVSRTALRLGARHPASALLALQGSLAVAPGCGPPGLCGGPHAGRLPGWRVLLAGARNARRHL